MTTDAVWVEFGRRLRGYIAGHVRGDADVDDVLQDVFAKIHAGLGTLQDEDRLEAWLFQVTRRAIADHHRRRRAVELPEDVAENPLARDASADVGTCLEPMMALIPEDDREALRLADLEGMSRKDLAARLGLSPTAAKSRVQRARARLKAALLDCCHVEMDRRGRPVDYSRKQADRGPCSCS